MTSIASKLIERFDSKKVFKFSDVDPFSEESSWISTHSPSLDRFLKTYGIPTGIVEVRGDSQAGKTTFTLMVIKSCLEEYGDRAVINILSSERRDNKPYAEKLGIDTEQIPIIRVVTIEDVFNKINQTITYVNEMIGKKEVELNGKPRFLFVWDSLGQTIGAQEKTAMAKRATVEEGAEGADKQAAMGAAARALSIGLRNVVGLSDDYDVTLMIINRAYDNIGSVGKSSYGGQAITFYPNVRIELARIKPIMVGEEEWGQITQIKTVKTDYDKPKQKFNIEIGYGLGFILTEEDLKLGFEAGILEKCGQNGAKFMKGKLQWKTRRELYGLYEDQNPLLKLLIKKLIKIAHDKVIEDKQK